MSCRCIIPLALSQIRRHVDLESKQTGFNHTLVSQKVNSNRNSGGNGSRRHHVFDEIFAFAYSLGQPDPQLVNKLSANTSLGLSQTSSPLSYSPLILIFS